MARETKVGLIVGLGVILFVSVFVSDYLSEPGMDDEFTEQLPDFNAHTNNQTPMPERAEREPEPVDTSRLAAVSLEQVERLYGPGPRAEQVGVPPVRSGSPIPLDREPERTPPAVDRYTPRGGPVGTRELDERGLAAGDQLGSDRIGPAQGLSEEMVRVEIPSARSQARQVLHTVEAGETLSNIAREHYDGDENMWRSIRDANPGKVGPNGEVVRGVTLVIPMRSTELTDRVTELGPASNGGGAAPRQRVRMITVKEGDSLSELAAEHLGSAGNWRRIMAVNEDVLEDPKLLREGMKLRIPVDDLERAAEDAERALAGDGDPTDPRPSAARTYTVQAGDNLFSIAARTLGDGERFKEIYQANRDKLSSADAIRPGMTLKLPER